MSISICAPRKRPILQQDVPPLQAFRWFNTKAPLMGLSSTPRGAEKLPYRNQEDYHQRHRAKLNGMQRVILCQFWSRNQALSDPGERLEPIDARDHKVAL